LTMSIPSSKITPASPQRAIRRKRLFSLLDNRMDKPVLWVSSPAGSGKTTLISTYLDSRRLRYIWYQCDEGDSDPATFFYYMGLAAKKALPRFKKALPLLTREYLANIPGFARRYFEQLYGRLSTRGEPQGSGAPAETDKAGFALVFDNYQDVPSDSPFQDMIATGFDVLPEGVHAMVISRTEPSFAFARLLANDKIDMLRYGDVRFTFEESRELALGRIPSLDEASMKIIHEKTAGWAAGMILMLEKERLEGTAVDSAADIKDDKVFDYFAGELFNRTDEKVRDFLLKTAFLPVLNVHLAERMTGDVSAGSILSKLNRNNFFTERLSGAGQSYQYHPLFRDFLLNQAKALFSPSRRALVQRKAAQLLEQSGLMEDAAKLYSDAGDRRALVRMVIRHARELLMQGRNATVEGWIAAVPGEAAEDNPWLLYWSGMCSFPVDMPRARRCLEEAFESFKVAGDTSGIYLSWAGIVDTYAFEFEEWKRLDDYIAAFDELRKAYPSFPSREIDLFASSRMLVALTLRKTDQPQLVQAYLDHVSALLQEYPSMDIQMDTAFCMSVYNLWKGEYQRNAILIEKAEAEIHHRKPSPFMEIRVKLMKGIHCWITAEYDSALKALSEGLDIADRSGVHVLDSLLWGFKAAAEMAPGNLESARIFLRNQMVSLLGKDKTLEIFFHHVNSAWYAILEENPLLASEHMGIIAARVEHMGNPYYRALWEIGMAQTEFLMDRRAEANDHIQTAHRISLAMKSHVMEWYSLLIQAYFLLREGKENEGLRILHRGLSIGRRHGFVHLEFYQPSVMRFLCAKALGEGIEPEYAKGLIRKLGLAPPMSPSPSAPPLYLENWPYPVRVYTHGRFDLIRDDKPLAPTGKMQKKPHEMLKAIIAFGGSNVPEERVTDALWPDATGDLGHKSFEMTLSRLRRLLGEESLIKYNAGQLSLDSLSCWVDSFELESVFAKIRGADADTAAQLCEKAVSLYKGPFLPSDTNLAWTASRRETMQDNLIREIIAAGRRHERAGRWEKAVEYYKRGLDADNLAEELYRRLMICFQKLGNKAEAVKTYNRCRKILKGQLGVEPSSKTEALYLSIKPRK